MYDPNDECPSLTHMFETGLNRGDIHYHAHFGQGVGERVIGTASERILEDHERCLETGEIRNIRQYGEGFGYVYVWIPPLWKD